MADATSSPPPPRPSHATTTGAFNAGPAGATRYRLPRRQSSTPTIASPPPFPGLPHRRSSILSFSSIEDASQSFADDILNPRTSRRPVGSSENEVTHWHSTPLAFAILPAIAGLLFKNGSAFVTDAMLLALAAVFMNWSIQIPWDWYYSAQAIRQDVGSDDAGSGDEIPEEPERDQTAITSSPESSPKQGPADKAAATASRVRAKGNEGAREAAAAHLRLQELLSLLATFIFPGLAAYLLHVIRAQLSRPSTTLVSDYNLSIFILAAELRPVRQVVRLMASRTLHLQRTATGLDDPFATSGLDKTSNAGLSARVDELEAKLSDHQALPSTVAIAHKADVSDLSAEMKKRYESRLEGLERAVRRYEKRSTTLTLLVEQRLSSLELRLQDALSLAAVAAQHSQRRGVFHYLLQTASSVVVVSLKVIWTICTYPFKALEDGYIKCKVLMLGHRPQRSTRRRHASRDSSLDEKSKTKLSGRKIVR